MAEKTTAPIDFQKAKKIGYQKIAQKEDIGLYILVCLETGLRIGDALALDKDNFYKKNNDYFVKFSAQKTGKEATRPVSEILYTQIMNRPSSRIFINPKTNKIYSKMWVGRNLKKCFISECKEAKKEGKVISSHSLRKSSGQLVYEKNGIEAARDFLQHQTYQVTKSYLSIGEREMNKLLKDTLLD